MLALLRQAFPTTSAADLSARLLYTANDSFFLNSTVSKLSIATYTNANGTVTQTVRVLRQPRPKLGRLQLPNRRRALDLRGLRRRGGAESGQPNAAGRERRLIQRRDAGGRPCVLLIGDWTRGGMLVDRDASRRFRLIGRDEKPCDLTWEGGRLTLRHAGRVVRRGRPVNAACPELPSAPQGGERP